MEYEKVLTAVINFLIMALVVFLMVKALNTASEKLAHKEDKPAEKPAKKICPMCKSEIAIDACRCPMCTTILDAKAVQEFEAKTGV